TVNSLPRVEIVAGIDLAVVDVEQKHARILREYLTHTVALMHVEIDIRHAAFGTQGALPPHLIHSETDVRVDRKPFPAVRLRVVITAAEVNRETVRECRPGGSDRARGSPSHRPEDAPIDQPGRQARE